MRCSQKGIDDSRIKLRTSAVCYLCGGYVWLHSVPVNARGHHGVKRIRDCQDPTPQRDAVGDHAIRIPSSVVPFMMGHDNIAHIRKARYPSDDRRTVFGMFAHNGEFLFSQKVLFEKDLRRNKGLAEVMKQGRDAQRFKVFVREMESCAHRHCQLCHAIGMGERKVVCSLKHLKQRSDHAFPHTPADCLFEQQLRAHAAVTVRRTNKVDPSRMSVLDKFRALGAATLFHHMNAWLFCKPVILL